VLNTESNSTEGLGSTQWTWNVPISVESRMVCSKSLVSAMEDAPGENSLSLTPDCPEREREREGEREREREREREKEREGERAREKKKSERD
jgi:hypothetical protein